MELVSWSDDELMPSYSFCAVTAPLILVRMPMPFFPMPALMSQRGLSGTRNSSRKKRLAGIISAPNILRHTSAIMT